LFLYAVILQVGWGTGILSHVLPSFRRLSTSKRRINCDPQTRYELFEGILFAIKTFVNAKATFTLCLSTGPVKTSRDVVVELHAF